MNAEGLLQNFPALGDRIRRKDVWAVPVTQVLPVHDVRIADDVGPATRRPVRVGEGARGKVVRAGFGLARETQRAEPVTSLGAVGGELLDAA